MKYSIDCNFLERKYNNLRLFLSSRKGKLTMFGTAVAVAAVPFFHSCKKDPNEQPTPPDDPKKVDVRIGYSLANAGQPNKCDGAKNSAADVLSAKAIGDTKKLPTTKDIIAYVACGNGRGLTVANVTALVNLLTAADKAGVKFEPGMIIVDDFAKADSIAMDKLGIKMDLHERPEPKQDVRIGYSLANAGQPNNCNGTKNSAADVLSATAISDVKGKPTTKDIFAYVACDNGRGLTEANVTALVNLLTAADKAGVKFEPGTIIVDDFVRADSIAMDKLGVTLDLHNREEREALAKRIKELTALEKEQAKDVRAAVKPALTEPSNLEASYWSIFNLNNIPLATNLLDSTRLHLSIIDLWYDLYGNPLPSNNETMTKLYDKCKIYIPTAEELYELINSKIK